MERKAYETKFVPRRERLPYLGDTKEKESREKQVIYITIFIAGLEENGAGGDRGKDGKHK